MIFLFFVGHSYVTYGPLLNAASQVIFEGVPTYPDAGRPWDITDKYKVTILYTAPTAIRSLMSFGNDLVTKYSRKSLRILGSVGEPINPEAWRWYHDVSPIGILEICRWCNPSIKTLHQIRLVSMIYSLSSD